MAKAIIKTTQNDASVDAFLSSVEDEQQRIDSYKIDKMMQGASGEKPKMWGASIIGYGLRHIKSPSGREVDWLKIGFSPRKGRLSLYVNIGCADYNKLLVRLGKYKTGKGCLYINKLTDVDEGVLEKLIVASFGNNQA